ncbi:MAG: hypothetical protein JWN44_1496 [Myxococcales bacterium]|nr:hypothetical protein [Myxococcales bacterium]
MKRLRDQRSAEDATVARAAELVSSRGPLADDVARKQRVRGRLRRRRRAPIGASLVRFALLVAVICSVAVASAMIGRVALSIRARLKAAPAAETHAASHRRRPAASGRSPEPAAPAAEAPPPVAAPPPPSVVAPVAAPARSIVAASPLHAAPSHAATARTAASTAPAAVETEEQRLLTAAVRALRHEHDAARAAALLGRYLDRYPDGIAAEDALALGLEATLGRDRPRAAAFGARYLSRYPTGRWAPLARRALEP